MRLLERTEWGAAAAERAPKPHPVTSAGGAVKTVFLHHSVTGASPFSQMCRQIQRIHLDHPSIPYTDVAYNFMVSNETDEAAVGRGALAQGGATRGRNGDSLAICAVGWFSTGHDTPTPQLVTNIAGLLRKLIKDGHVAPDFRLLGHREASATECPGGLLFTQIGRIEALAKAVDPVAPVDPSAPDLALLTAVFTEQERSAAKILAMLREHRKG